MSEAEKKAEIAEERRVNIADLKAIIEAGEEIEKRATDIIERLNRLIGAATEEIKKNGG